MNFVEKESEFDKKDMQIDWECENCGSNLWQYEDFCKITDLQIWIVFFKEFQILGIVFFLL